MASVFQNKGGLSQAGAIGLVSGFVRESDLNPNAGAGTNYYGIGQWSPQRQADFAALTGHSMVGSSVQEQMQFALWELNHTQKKAGDMLRSAKSTIDGVAGSNVYEDEKDQVGGTKFDLGVATQIAKIMPGGSSTFPSIAPDGNAIGSDGKEITGEGKSYKSAFTGEPVMFDSQSSDDRHVAVDVTIKHDGSITTRQTKASPSVTAKIKTATPFADNTGWVN